MSGLTANNVVATFEQMEQAREAVLALGRVGIDADKVSMIGKDVEEVASDPDTRLRDLEVTGEVAKKAALGGVAGTVLGGLAGAAAFIIPGVGPVIGSGIWAAVAAAGVAGGAVGGMVGGVASIDLNDEWELTFQEALKGGKVLVAVHADDEEQAGEARRTLEQHGPEKVVDLGAEGHPVEGG